MRTRLIKLHITLIVAMIAAFFFVPTSAVAEEQTARNSLVLYDDYGNVFRFYDDLIEPTNHLVYEELFERKANCSPKEKSEFVRSTVRRGVSAEKALEYAYPKLKQFISEACDVCELPPKDSRIIFNPDAKPVFTITRDHSGRRVNRRALYSAIYSAWQKSVAAEIKIIYEDVSPDFTVEDAKAQTHLKARFSTDYSASNQNRKHNVELALKKINGCEIPAGGSFSFNGTVGARTERNGFKEAKIIVGGEFVEGIGGGVCQVSTTVYNAALEAGMNVDCAVSHSLPPTYVAPSFDAMVNSGSSDLKFTNPTQTPVYVRAVGDGKRITVEFYGAKNQYKIVRKSVVTARGAVPNDKVIEDSELKYVTEDMQSGEMIRIRAAVAGLESEGYLLYYENGALVKERRIRKDKYAPICGIVAKKP